MAIFILTEHTSLRGAKRRGNPYTDRAHVIARSEATWQSLTLNETQMDKYYIYFMSNKYDSVLYVGVTNNLERRVIEHRTGNSDAFTARYNCSKLVYYEEYSSIDEAIAREKQIKSWNRARKEKLIDSMNPEHKELMP